MKATLLLSTALVLLRSNIVISSHIVEPDGLTSSMRNVSAVLDWSFLDAVFLITCPESDKNSERLNRTMKILDQIGLVDSVKVKEFEIDQEDRKRGCYSSHLSVMRDALQELKSSPSNPTGISNKRVLILEDNLGLMGGTPDGVWDGMVDYISPEADNEWDVFQLSYIPYVPNLSISRTSNDHVVKLSCGIGSALGTSSYILSENAMRSIVEHDNTYGYYAPIPDVMAEIFPETRFASHPTPFMRNPSTKSLVNPQLDELRVKAFQPSVLLRVQQVMVTTGLSTNTLLPLTIVSLLGMSFVSGQVTISALWSLFTTGSYGGGSLIVPAVSSAVSAFSLYIIGQGCMMAPKPPQTAVDSSNVGDNQIVL